VVTGKEFHPLVNGNLVNPGRARIDASFSLSITREGTSTDLTEVEWLTLREISAMAPSGLAVGLYSVELRDPRGRTTSLPDGLEVVDAECTTDADCRAANPCAATATCATGMCNASAALLDADDDGHTIIACGGDDCDDTCDVCWTGHAEDCDGLDNDCDGATLDGADEVDLGAACDGADLDACQEGVLECNGSLPLDCNDTTPTDVEVCDGGTTDENCDGTFDEEDAQNCVSYDFDADRDTHGVAVDSRCLCSPDAPAFYDTTLDDDCDDSCNVCWTGNPEICGDGEDNDCSGTADDPPAGWWNAGWQGRMVLSVDETAAGSLPIDYTVALTSLGTSAYVTAGTMLANGDDVRVVWSDGSSFVELDRHLINIDSASTGIWFKTLAAIDVTDGSYAIYFDNPSAGAPPAHWADSMGAAGTPSGVYLAGDDFEEETVGAAPDGWEGSANYTVALDGGNKVLDQTSVNPDADYFFAGDYAWGDVVVNARLRILDTSGDYYGLYLRAQPGNNFYTVYYGPSDNTTIQVWTMTIADPWAIGLSSSTSRGSSNVSSLGTTWHALSAAMIGRDIWFYLDGTEKLTYRAGASYQQGRIGLCVGYAAGQAYWDDFTVRKYVSPEPTVGISLEETSCP